jgi:hypothetical protein
MKFLIRNKPVWAQFDATTGLLSGRPNRLQSGTFGNIVIRVINWYGFSELRPFSITVSPALPAAAPNSPPSIAGRPAASIGVGTAYSFVPTASDANHDSLKFGIQNKPDWASFNTTSGALSGTPAAADVGTYAKITISVSDGKVSVALPAFTVAVNQISTGNAALSWTPSTENIDGSVLTNLAGYIVHYGNSAHVLTQTIKITNPGLTRYVVDNLSPGTWYFAMSAYTSTGTEGDNTGVVTTRIL